MSVTFREMQISDYEKVMALWQQTDHMVLREADNRDNILAYLDKTRI